MFKKKIDYTVQRITGLHNQYTNAAIQILTLHWDRMTFCNVKQAEIEKAVLCCNTTSQDTNISNALYIY